MPLPWSPLWRWPPARRGPERPSGGDTGGSAAPSKPGAVQLPPRNAGFDYQIGGAYPPPAGVRIVARDRAAEPAPGLYNICYVNAFQAQPDARDDWPADLLLRDKKGEVVVDGDWDEALLDIGTPAKRRAYRRPGQPVDRRLRGQGLRRRRAGQLRQLHPFATAC